MSVPLTPYPLQHRLSLVLFILAILTGVGGEGETGGRREGLERAWESGMVEMEEGQIWEQGRRYLN